MSSLSQELLGVTEAHSNDAGHNYRKIIAENGAALDDVARKLDPSGQPKEENVYLFAKAAVIVLGEDKIILPESSTYKAEQELYWSKTNMLPTACFVKLSSTAEVALAVKLVTLLNVSFSIRAGGHMPNPTFNSIGKHGVTLDLSGMNSIHLEDNVCSVGPGATWDKIYEYLDPLERAVVGGRVVGIGAGGLITGGGMSHTPNFWGMACDNVENFEVVLGDSRAVQANAKDNTDLYKALKGGGSNFGIVTRFDLKTYPDYQIWQQVYLYSAADDDRVAEAYTQVLKAMEHNNRLGMTLQVLPEGSTAVFWHRGWSDKVPDDFQSAFGDLTPKEILMPGTNVTAHQIIVPVPKTRAMFGTTAFRNDAATYKELFQEIHAISLPVRVEFNFQALAKSSVDRGLEQGGNIMGIQPETLSVVGWVVTWLDEALDEEAKKMMGMLYEKLTGIARARGNLMDTIFMNDAWYEQDVIGSYGKANVDFMWEMSRKYDPGQVFQKLQNDGFLLSKRGGARLL